MCGNFHESNFFLLDLHALQYLDPYIPLKRAHPSLPSFPWAKKKGGGEAVKGLRKEKKNNER
jgi:hypothetical protein